MSRQPPSPRRPLRRGAWPWLALIACVLATGGQAAPPPKPSPRPDCTRPLTLGLHDHGLLYSSRTGEGIDKDIADELARRSGCRLTTTVLPRARIWQLLESGLLDFSLSAIDDPQREKFAAFAWYESNKYYLLVRRDADVASVAAFHRRHGLRLGVIRGFRYGSGANALVDALDGEQRVSYATTLEPLYAVLDDNRIQAMIVEPFDYPAIETAKWRAQTTVLEFGDPSVAHGLVMSRRSLDAAQRAAWQEIIRGMREDGTVQRIFEKYFPADLARSMTRF